MLFFFCTSLRGTFARAASHMSQEIGPGEPLDREEADKLRRHARILERTNLSLADRVHRLEAVLREAHGSAAVPAAAGDGTLVTGVDTPPSPPWSEQTGPLLLAYDRRIAELSDALEVSKDQILGFTARMQAVTDENATLRAELKQYVDKAINFVDVTGSTQVLGGSGASAAAVEMRELIEQLEVANETVDMVSDNNAALESEVSELRASLADAVAKRDAAQSTLSESRAGAEELRRHNVQLEQERKSAETMLQDMSALRTRLQANLAREREETVAVTAQRDSERETIVELKKAMEASAAGHGKEIDAADELRRTHVEHIDQLRAEVEAASRERVALGAAHDALVKEHDAVRQACTGMLEDMSKYERQLATLKQAEEQMAEREADAERRVHENALLQEQAEVRATRSRKEADRLRQVLQTAGANALRREQYLVAQERQRVGKQLDAREAELQLVLQRCASAEAKFERARREKASAVASAARLSTALASAEERMLATIDDIVQKRTAKEEENESAVAEAQAANERLARTTLDAQRKETRHRDAMRAVTQKNEALEVQIDELSARAVRVEAQLASAAQRVSRAEAEKDDALRRMSSDLAVSKQRSTLAHQALQHRLNEAIEASRSAQEEKTKAAQELDEVRFQQATEGARVVATARAEAQEQRRLVDAARARVEAMEAEVSEVMTPVCSHELSVLLPFGADLSPLRSPSRVCSCSASPRCTNRPSHSRKSATTRCARTPSSPRSATRSPRSAAAPTIAPPRSAASSQRCSSAKSSASPGTRGSGARAAWRCFERGPRASRVLSRGAGVSYREARRLPRHRVPWSWDCQKCALLISRPRSLPLLAAHPARPSKWRVAQ